MTQVARPQADISNSGWSPTPLWQQIVQQTPTDSPFIQSAGSPGGDTFEVALDTLLATAQLPQTLTIRWRLTQPARLPVTVTLLQGSTVIATRILYPGLSSSSSSSSSSGSSGFVSQTIALTAAEAGSITDYSQLRVQISTVPPSIQRRALGTAASSLTAQTTLTLPGVTVSGGELLVVGVGSAGATPTQVTFNGSPLQQAVAALNSSGPCWAGIYSLAVAADTTGDLVVTWPSAVKGLVLAADAIAALSNNSLDRTAQGTGTGTSLSSGSSAQTTQAKEYLHGLLVYVVPQFGINLTWQNGFSGGQGFYSPIGSQWNILGEGTKVVSAQGSYAAAATLTQSVSWAALLATFS